MKQRLSFLLSGAALAGLGLISTGAYAQKGGGSTTPADGVITIDQTKAVNGGVTPGDAPGFPVTISQPGHYRLTGNLTVDTVRTSGIQITAAGVTLDLNGFTISGPSTCTGGSPATITCTPVNDLGAAVIADRNFVTVRNGTVKGFYYGVFVGFFGRVENVTAAYMLGDGIAAQNSSIVKDNIVYMVGGSGITSFGELRGNSVYMAKYNGISTASGSGLIGNRVTLVGGWGIDSSYGNAALANNSITQATAGAIRNAVQMEGNACNGAPCQ